MVTHWICAQEVEPYRYKVTLDKTHSPVSVMGTINVHENVMHLKTVFFIGYFYLFILLWQWMPSNPASQRQLYVLMPSTHVPPLRHVTPAHSLISAETMTTAVTPFSRLHLQNVLSNKNLIFKKNTSGTCEKILIVLTLAKISVISWSTVAGELRTVWHARAALLTRHRRTSVR